MWNIERTPGVLVGPRRWRWEVMFTSYGACFGYAWTRRQAERRLWDSQAELLSESLENALSEL